MDPTRVWIDQTLLIAGIAAYVTGALLLFGWFLMRTPRLLALGIPFAVAGCAAQFAELGTRWWMTGVWPLTNLYGSLSLFSAFGVAIFLIFAFRYGFWIVGWPVLSVAAIALGYATMWNSGYMPAVPALQSYWIKIHVPIVIAAYASFMVAACIAMLYLFKNAAEERYRARPGGAALATAMHPAVDLTLDAFAQTPSLVRNDTPAIAAAAEAGDPTARWIASLPSLARLDIMQFRVIAVGLPLLSLGIITGALWAKEAWGAYWQWDPKETAALISWIVYAAYMHLHTRASWKGAKTAWVSLLGFASIVFCYLGVNIWISGLHSYRT